MFNSEEFLRQAAVQRAGANAAAVDKAITGAQQGRVSEAIAKAGIISEQDLGALLADFARNELAHGRNASAESVQFGMTLLRKGKAKVHDVWNAVRAQEQGRAGGKERSLDYYISKTTDLDPAMTIDILKETGKDLLVCRDCGHREIVTGAETTGDFTCPECSGVLVPADQIPKDELKNTEKDAEPDPLVGQIIAECKLEKKLGQGGMGYVYKAKHLALNKPVAIKFLSDHILNETAKKRFLREARAAAKLEHGNIVSVYNTGTDQGKHFIIMQFIEGESVGDRLKRTGALPVAEAVRVCIEAGKGIAAAHDVEMIHRDIKPDNIMVDRKGNVKVADFGLAKDLTDDTGITISQQAMGTPHYMSPEQAEDARTADKRSDIYSFGATMYAILAGSAPFQGTTPWAIISQHQTMPVADIRTRNTNVPEGLWLIIKKMMEKKKDNRYQDMNDVIRDMISVYQKLGPSLEAMSGPLPRGQYAEMKTPATISPDYSHATQSGKTAAPAPAYAGMATPATIAPQEAPAKGKGKLLMGIAAFVLVAAGAGAALYFSGVLNPKGGGAGGGSADSKNQKDPNAGPGTDQDKTGGGSGTAVPDKPPADSAMEDAAREYLKDVMTEVDTLAGSQDYDDAMGKLARFPAKYEKTRAWDEVESRKAGILTMAAATYRSKLDSLRVDPEKCSDALKSAREWLGALKFLADSWNKSGTVSDFMAITGKIEGKVKEIEKLDAEMKWISGTRSGLDKRNDTDLAEDLKRLDLDSKGAVPGSENAARLALADLSAEAERRSKAGAREDFDKALEKARNLARSGNTAAAIDELKRFESSRDESIRSDAAKAVAAMKQAADKGALDAARTAFEKAKVAAEAHARAGRIPEALAEIESFLKSPFDEIARAAEAFASSLREQKGRLADLLEKVRNIKSHLETGKWSDIEKAEVILSAMLKDDHPEGVKNRISEAVNDVAAAKRSRIEAFEKRGLVVVAAVKGSLGSAETEDNKPHDVDLRPFLIGRYEVTNSEYLRFLRDTGRKPPQAWRKSAMQPGEKDRPAANISADEAIEFCKWLAGKIGLKLRLPTPDEWEAAAGFDSQPQAMRKYPWGAAFKKDAAHLSGKSTVDVGSFKDDQSPFGSFDMAGNVCEWTCEPGGSFTVCGGCYEDAGDEKAARCHFRQSMPKDTRAASLGFRVAADLD